MAWFRRNKETMAAGDGGAKRPLGASRAAATLVGAAAAGLLIWLATQVADDSTGGYWAEYGLLAAAGLTLALSQVAGGWTKWGMPRFSAPVFLVGFLPVLIVGGWILLAHQPDSNWFQSHVTNWSGDIGIGSFVDDWQQILPALALGIGVVFGFCFDTAGRRMPAPAAVEAVDRRAADEPVTAERYTVPAHDGERAAVGTPAAPEPEAAPRHMPPPDDTA